MTPIVNHTRQLTMGVSAGVLGVLLFCTMDALIKWLGQSYPVHQLMFFRTTVAFVPVLILLYRAGGWRIISTRRPGLHAIRSVIGLLAMSGAFYGFSTLPLADAVSVFYTAPLLAVGFSVPILGEKVGMRRWTAVGIGLIGVLIIARPGGDVYNLGGLLMLMASVMVALTSNIIRELNKTDAAICITFYFTLSGAIVTSIASLFLGWQTPGWTDLLLLMAIGLLGGSAQYALTLSFRYGEIAIIAPLKYLSIVFGGLLGYFIWAEVPDRITLLGISIILLSGLYSVHREVKLARETDNRDKMVAVVDK